MNEIVSLPVGAPARRLLMWTVVASALLAAFASFHGLQSYSLLFFGSLVLFGGMLWYALKVPTYSATELI